MTQERELKKLSLEALRNQISPSQRKILDEVWRHFQANGEWPGLRGMYSRYGKKHVADCLNPLGASMVQEYEDYEKGGRCVLHLLGALMTSEGQKLRELLVRFFQFQWKLFKDEPEKLRVTAEEIANTLALDDMAKGKLGQLLFLGQLGGSNRTDLGWSANATREIESIAAIDDIERYVDEWILCRYNPYGSVFQEDRKKEINPIGTNAFHSILAAQTETKPTHISLVNDPFKRRYQVFVSSTYEDLIEERQAVMHALLELDCIPSGMELFPAADDDQWTLIKRVIDDCDYYMVILAGRYGSLGASGASYTQMEYEYAVSKNKPVIAFLHKNPAAIQVHKYENTDEGRIKLAGFRALVERKVCKYWGTPDELGSVVSRSLIQLIKTKPAIGWVRGDLVTDESSAQEILKLRRKIKEVEQSLPSQRGFRPNAPSIVYLTKMVETFPRNAIQETQTYIDEILKYAIRTHNLDDSDDFPTRLGALLAHGDLDSEQKNPLVEFCKQAACAKSDPAFHIVPAEALRAIKAVTIIAESLAEKCDKIRNLRNDLAST